MKTCFVLPLAIAALSTTPFLAACSSSSTPSGNDAGTPSNGVTSDAATSDAATSDAAAGDAAAAVQGCAPTDFEDHTATGDARTITPWNTSLGTKCYTIKVGQSVTWDGVPTASHPLGATTDGTQPNPITNVPTTAFPTAGVYGWHCTIHTGLMKGAIQVVP